MFQDAGGTTNMQSESPTATTKLILYFVVKYQPLVIGHRNVS